MNNFSNETASCVAVADHSKLIPVNPSNLGTISRPRTKASRNEAERIGTTSKIERSGSQEGLDSRSSNRRPQFIQDGEAWCALNNPKLPPITEMEHMVDQCFCHLCNCGKHTCPGDYRRMFKSASSQFSTVYKIKYPKHPLPNINMSSKKLYTPNSLPIDLLTTNKKDFKPFVVEPKLKEKKHSDHLKLKFAGKSFYQSEFPNWGPYHADRIRFANLPYRGGEVKFGGTSSYATDFRIQDDLLDLNVKFALPDQHKGSNVISPSADFMGQTTSVREFKPFTKKSMAKRERGLSNEFRPSTSWNGQFSTTYRDNFTGVMNERFQRKKAALHGA